jgi:hypothetical protein
MQATPVKTAGPVKTSSQGVQSPSVEQLAFVGAVEAIGTRMRQVSTVIGPTTLPTDAAWATPYRTVAGVASVVMSPAMPTMQSDTPCRANHAQG